ncbi:MAG: nuclear transport factor 2 family protein [Mesorhizobium sp.]|uniref:nuclear transport factor 2 family protein n=1 Tax=Mesorhizobium sp. TaxID=1871066 RepID=UPI001AD1F6CB|nr:nuclear transport factor 2 family protein [Mesorhizobium sp.]MBN9221326.1 nuclear transport factor 2 family protein [Mesorhizobium sp.]
MDTTDAVAKAVRETAQMYLDALFFGDVQGFRSVFHPQAHLYSATEGKLVHLTVDAYMDIVANRPSPQEKGDPRQDEIISISVGSPTTAHVRVKDVYLPKKFVDDLTLVQIDGKWQIVSKVWHFDL